MSILVVQMGHSGRISGATGAPGEMAFAEAVGTECARALSGGDWNVRLIAADPAPSAYRGDAFMAVHADGSVNPNVRGASVGYQTPEGHGLATRWAAEYTALGWTGPWNPDNYTVNLAQYYGVRQAVAEGCRSAFIAECGTITNPAERDAMASPTGIERVALAIGRAVGIIVPPVPVPANNNQGAENMVITCATPNRCGILSGGVLLDITDDTTARGYAQQAINKGTLVELRVTQATWDRFAARTK